MPDAVPLGIPRRLVFRVLADALGGQVRHLEGLPSQTRRRRPGAAAAVSKQLGRSSRWERLRSQASTFSLWIGDPAHYQGQPIDAAVVGYLVALAYGHSDALAELRAELADLGSPGLVDGTDARDLVEIVRRLLSA